MDGPTSVLWYSSVAVRFLFCAHLLWTRLAKAYPIFTLYLGCSVLRSLAVVHYSAGAGPDGALPLSYTYFWLWTEPILLALQIGITLEVHAALWREYGAMLRSSRPLLLFSLLTALLFAALPVRAELGQFSAIRLQAVMQFEFLTKRYISTVLAVFLLLSALLFLMVVRNSVKSSLFRHESMLAAYLAIYAIAYFVTNMGTKAIFVNNYMLSALTLCLVVWISVFRPHSGLPNNRLHEG
jgi:hypothetical protein